MDFALPNQKSLMSTLTLEKSLDFDNGVVVLANNKGANTVLGWITPDGFRPAYLGDHTDFPTCKGYFCCSGGKCS